MMWETVSLHMIGSSGILAIFAFSCFGRIPRRTAVPGGARCRRRFAGGVPCRACKKTRFYKGLLRLKGFPQFGTRAPQSASASAASRADAQKNTMSERDPFLTSYFLRCQCGSTACPHIWWTLPCRNLHHATCEVLTMREKEKTH